MPQEFHVLKCYQCSTFQVHQVKKAKKWCCKMCGEKQSIIKVYGQGNAADCRHHVQRLNSMRGEIEKELLHVTDYISEKDSQEQIKDEAISASSSDRWSKYLAADEEIMERSNSDLWSKYETPQDEETVLTDDIRKRKRKHWEADDVAIPTDCSSGDILRGDNSDSHYHFDQTDEQSFHQMSYSREKESEIQGQKWRKYESTYESTYNVCKENTECRTDGGGALRELASKSHEVHVNRKPKHGHHSECQMQNFNQGRSQSKWGKYQDSFNSSDKGDFEILSQTENILTDVCGVNNNNNRFRNQSKLEEYTDFVGKRSAYKEESEITSGSRGGNSDSVGGKKTRWSIYSANESSDTILENQSSMKNSTKDSEKHYDVTDGKSHKSTVWSGKVQVETGLCGGPAGQFARPHQTMFVTGDITDDDLLL